MRPRYIHFGSFNIEHFGRNDDSPTNVFPITEHIEMSGVDIIALQEIYVDEVVDGRRKNKLLSQICAMMHDHNGGDWRNEIVGNRVGGDKSQLCAFLWNNSVVQKKGETFEVPVPQEVDELDERGRPMKIWDRRPHAAMFEVVHPSDGAPLTDFIMVPVHMKSNIGPRHTVMRKRYWEAKTLVDSLEAITDNFSAEKDVVILGDTNCKSRDEAAIQALIDGGFEDLNADDTSTYYRGSDAPFDRIFVPRGRRAFEFSRQYIMSSASPLSHDRFISDHYLIKASFVVRRDDDGPS